MSFINAFVACLFTTTFATATAFAGEFRTPGEEEGIIIVNGLSADEYGIIIIGNKPVDQAGIIIIGNTPVDQAGIIIIGNLEYGEIANVEYTSNDESLRGSAYLDGDELVVELEGDFAFDADLEAGAYTR